MFISGTVKSHWQKSKNMDPTEPRVKSQWEGYKSQTPTKESHWESVGVLKHDVRLLRGSVPKLQRQVARANQAVRDGVSGVRGQAESIVFRNIF